MPHASTTFAYEHKEQLLETLKSRLLEVYGFNLIDFDENNWFYVYSGGETGKDGMLFKFYLDVANNELKVMGFQEYNSNDKKAYSFTYADRYWAIGRLLVKGEKGVVWMYGDKNAIMIVNKNFEEQGNGTVNSQVTAIYFGRYVPAYDDYVSVVDLGSASETGNGTNVVLKVEDASKFLVNRAYVISDTKHAEKVIVVNRDLQNNTITLDKLSYSYKPYVLKTAETVGTPATYEIPILIGEMPRPYIIIDWWKSTPQTLLSNVGMPDFPEFSDTQGIGQIINFYEPSTLVEAATFDQLNQDRYLFDTYIYTNNPSGFYGKFDLFYVLGATGIQPEISVLNDNTWIYRAFQIYGLSDLVAIRENKISS